MAQETNRSGRSSRREERGETAEGAEREREGRGEQAGERSRRERERRQPRGSLAPIGPMPSLFALRPHDLFTASPFELMRRFSDEMNRAFEGFGLGNGGGMFSPAVEIQQRENELVACIDLPGLEPDDLQLDITEDGIVVRGERRREQQEEREGWTRSEVSYGEFMRTIPLPPSADFENASARFEKGVLRIRVPIAEARGRRTIPIEMEARAEGSERGQRGDGGEREERPGRSRGQAEGGSAVPPAS